VGITHAAYPVSSELKSALLVELLKRGDLRSVLAFTRTKHRANRLADYLQRNGVKAGRIHGNRSQAQRTEALGSFKAGRSVLVATDIAARGIDIDALSSRQLRRAGLSQDYVHRAGGRTASHRRRVLFVAPRRVEPARDREGIGKRLPASRSRADYSEAAGGEAPGSAGHAASRHAGAAWPCPRSRCGRAPRGRRPGAALATPRERNGRGRRACPRRLSARCRGASSSSAAAAVGSGVSRPSCRRSHSHALSVHMEVLPCATCGVSTWWRCGRSGRT
jgi:ATP-dependent RNA helicase RhlE